MNTMTGTETESKSSQYVKRPERVSLAIFLVLVGIALGAIWTVANQQERGYLPPCQTEDSVNCYWDASEQGNGLGNDFIAIEGEDQ